MKKITVPTSRPQAVRFSCLPVVRELAIVMRKGPAVTLTSSFPFLSTEFELVQVTPAAPRHVRFLGLLVLTTTKQKKQAYRLKFSSKCLDFLEEYCSFLGKLILLGDFSAQIDRPCTSKTFEILTTYQISGVV